MPAPLPLLDHPGAPPGAAGSAEAGISRMLDQLRSPFGVRPAVDPGLAGGLRAWLEDGVAAVGCGPAPVTIQPGPGGALCGADGNEGRPSVRDVRTALLRTAFRITVTTGPTRAPFEDSLGALAVDEDGASVVEAVQRLSRHRRAQLREVVRHDAARIAADWTPPPAAWLPRTGERLVAPLAGGRVVLRSQADLVLGRPSSGRASICALRVHGGPAGGDGSGRRLLALLETLRSGAAPFRVASYDLDRGVLTVEDVRDDHLSAAVREVLAVLDRGSNDPGPGR